MVGCNNSIILNECRDKITRTRLQLACSIPLWSYLWQQRRKSARHSLHREEDGVDGRMKPTQDLRLLSCPLWKQKPTTMLFCFLTIHLLFSIFQNFPLAVFLSSCPWLQNHDCPRIIKTSSFHMSSSFLSSIVDSDRARRHRSHDNLSCSWSRSERPMWRVAFRIITSPSPWYAAETFHLLSLRICQPDRFYSRLNNLLLFTDTLLLSLYLFELHLITCEQRFWWGVSFSADVCVCWLVLVN